MISQQENEKEDQWKNIVTTQSKVRKMVVLGVYFIKKEEESGRITSTLPTVKDTTTCTRGESETFAEYRSPEGKSTRGDARKQSHGRCHNHARIARKYAKL